MLNPLKDILDGITALRHTQDGVLRTQQDILRRQERIVATLEQATEATNRYRAAVEARDARQKAALTADEAQIGTQAQEITDLNNHAIPDDMVAAANDAAAAIEAENAAAAPQQQSA